MKTVIKVGGSLERYPEILRLAAVLGNTGYGDKILVVPGGGKFADAVRECYKKYSLEEEIAHWMSILGMDQYGYLLSSLIPGSKTVTGLDNIWSKDRDGLTPILLPFRLMKNKDPLPKTWDVTSDSISAWIASFEGADRLILLKSADGFSENESILSESTDPAKKITPGQLKDSDIVDRYFHEIIEKNPMDLWLLNGRFPDRLVRLFETGTTRGLHINRSEI